MEGGDVSWKEQSHTAALAFLLPHRDLSRNEFLPRSSRCYHGCLQNSQLEPILIIVERNDINPDFSGGLTDPVSTR